MYIRDKLLEVSNTLYNLDEEEFEDMKNKISEFANKLELNTDVKKLLESLDSMYDLSEEDFLDLINNLEDGKFEECNSMLT